MNMGEMANLPRDGFTIFVERGRQKLTLCRALPDCHAAVAMARAIATDRPGGLKGMIIRCEATREQWAVAELIEQMDRDAKPQPRR
jgi:hypothetical protein